MSRRTRGLLLVSTFVESIGVMKASEFTSSRKNFRSLLGADAAVNLERLLDVRLGAPRPLELRDGGVE